jgi:hypothetical protein
MPNNFMLFSDLQKQLSPSPIKSWRLLKQLRDNGRMRDQDDFIMQDRKLYVNVPRFIVELEALGYAQMKSGDFNNGDVKSDEIKKIAEELKLISSEITESRIQDEMKSDDFIADEVKPNIHEKDVHIKEPLSNLKSDDFNINNLKSTDFSNVPREIIETKNELIDVLKGTVSSRDQDIVHLREVITELSQQNKTLTQQNGWLTNLLVAPKQETEPMRSAKVRVTDVMDDDIDDFTDEITHDEDVHHESKSQQATPGEPLNQEQREDDVVADEPEQSAS